MHEWYFNPVNKNSNKADVYIGKPIKQHHPIMSKQDIALLLRKEEIIVASLPVRTDKKYTCQELEIKRNYPRAYEYWTIEELEIMKRVYKQCKSVDVVASLLKRQPHMVKERIDG